MPRVTCRTIAEHLKLSKETVTHILGGRAERFRPETVARVEAAARELGYRKHGAAKAMRTGRHNAIGLVGRIDIGPLHFEIQRWTIDQCRKRDWHVLATELKIDDLGDPEHGPLMLRELAVDGLLVHYARAIPDALIDLVAATRSPVVWINTQHPTDAVYPDDAHAWDQALAALHEAGHRRIAYIGPPPPHSHPSWRDRETGACAAAAAHGCQCQVHHVPDNWRQLGWDRIRWCRALLTGPARPTAVLMPRASDAASMVAAAAAEGLEVPRDLSLVAITDGGHATCQGIPLAHMRIPSRELAMQALAMLSTKIDTPATQASVAVPFDSLTTATITKAPSL
ncbi:MAG: LacI family DNA-binding transcriptional regulator [Planctomycetota bacterium]|jgi:LacI family transcriptional regulator|nr:LacI family DNA-binding transcriptional regulator [Planctomycetota bacterium]